MRRSHQEKNPHSPSVSKPRATLPNPETTGRRYSGQFRNRRFGFKITYLTQIRDEPPTMKRGGNPAPVLSVSKSLRETHRPLQRRLSLLGPADATTTTASTMTRRVRRLPARYRDVSVDIPAAERHPRRGVSSDAPLPPGTYVELVSHPGEPSLLAVIEAVDPSIHPAAPAPADAAIYTLMHLVRLSTLMRAPDAEPHASALRRAGYPVDGQLETHGRWELVALRLPTSRAYARTAFARVRLLDVDWYEDVIDAEPVDESTRYVWRFELDQERGLTPKPNTLRRDVCFPDRRCAFNSFHCVHGGGYVLCDGCDRPHHIRCADVDPNVGADEPWFCGDACRRRASSKIETVRAGKIVRETRAPHEKAAPASDTHASKRAKKSRCPGEGYARGSEGYACRFGVPRLPYRGTYASAHETWMARGSENGRRAPPGRFVDDADAAFARHRRAEPRHTPRTLAVDRDVIVISDDEEDREEKEGSKRARGFEDATREPRVPTSTPSSSSPPPPSSTPSPPSSPPPLPRPPFQPSQPPSLPSPSSPTIGPSLPAANWFVRMEARLENLVSRAERSIPVPTAIASRDADDDDAFVPAPKREAVDLPARRGWGRGRGVGVSGYRGVHRAGSRWVAVGFERVAPDTNRRAYLGCFDTPKDAARAYDAWGASRGKTLNGVGDEEERSEERKPKENDAKEAPGAADAEPEKSENRGASSRDSEGVVTASARGGTRSASTDRAEMETLRRTREDTATGPASGWVGVARAIYAIEPAAKRA